MPTFENFYQVGNWYSTNNTISISNVSVNAGDLVVVATCTAWGGDPSPVNEPTGGGITFTEGIAVLESEYVGIHLFYGVAPSSTTFTLSATKTISDNDFGMGCWVFSDHNGVGNIAGEFETDDTPADLSFTMSEDNAAIIVAYADWRDRGAIDWRTNFGAVTEQRNQSSGQNLSTIALGFHDSSVTGSARTASVGTLDNAKPTICALEILPAPSSVDANIAPSTISRTATIAGSNIAAGQGATEQSSTVSRVVTVASPSVLAGVSVTVEPEIVSTTAALSGANLLAGTGASEQSSTISRPVSFGAASIIAGQQAVASPGTISDEADLGRFDIVVKVDQSIGPDIIARTIAIESPFIAAGAGSDISASTITGDGVVAEAVVGAGETAQPGTITGSAFLTSTVGAGQSTEPETLLGSTTLSAPEAAVDSPVVADSVTGNVSFAAPTVVAAEGANYLAGTISAPASIDSHNFSSSAAHLAAAITVGVAIAGGTVAAGTGQTTEPATIERSASIASPVVGESYAATPATVSSTVTLDDSQAGIGSFIVGETVVRSVTVPVIQVGTGITVTPETISRTARVHTGEPTPWAVDANAEIVIEVVSKADILGTSALAEIDVGVVAKADIQNTSVGADMDEGVIAKADLLNETGAADLEFWVI